MYKDGVLILVKSLTIKEYRKLKNLELDFDENVNLIAGSNGTCKSSLLYLISNSYKKVIQTGKSANLAQCLKVIDNINSQMNPKIETLTKGDKNFNDPAPDIKGEIFKVIYKDDSSISFRKHNSIRSNRFSVKPTYKNGDSDKLPECPVIYLGLPRLFPFGEFENTNQIPKQKIFSGIAKILNKSEFNIEISNEILENIKSYINSLDAPEESIKIKNRLPQPVQNEINNLYYEFTNIKIKENSNQYASMGRLKNRGDFSTEVNGVDSNTISAGEDNLYIILTAIVSLKYFFEECKKLNLKNPHSILLIDEVDATLHPYYQIKLLELLNDFTKKYNIQFIGTTHSFTLLEHAFIQKNKVIYLIDSIDSVDIVPDITFEKIKMFLNEVRLSELVSPSKIAIFTEDEEARLFLQIIFNHLNLLDPDFSHALSRFYLVPSKLGSDSLTTIFCDKELTSEFIRSICVLDGDQNKNITNNIIILPGKNNPETFILDYLETILRNPSEHQRKFLKPNSLALSLGYQTRVIKKKIIDERYNIEENITQKKEQGDSTKGIRRNLYKKLFKDNEKFFTLLFDFWLKDPLNQKEVLDFYNSLHAVFCKTAFAHGINHSIWPKKDIITVAIPTS